MKVLKQRPSEAKRRGTVAITSAGAPALGAPIALQEQELAYAALLSCVKQAATTSRERKPRARPATAPSRSGQPAPHRNKRISSRALEQAGVIHRATTGSIPRSSCILAHCERSRGADAEAHTIVRTSADSTTAAAGKQRAASAGTRACSSSVQFVSITTSRRAQSALPTTAAPPPCSAARSFQRGRSAGCYRAVSARHSAAASELSADSFLLQLPLDVLQFQIDELNKSDWLADSLAATATVASAMQARLKLRCNVTLPQPLCTDASELESQSVSSFATAEHKQSQRRQQQLLSDSCWPATSSEHMLEHGATGSSTGCYDSSASDSLLCCSTNAAISRRRSRSSSSGSSSSSSSSSSSFTTAVQATHSSNVPAEVLRHSISSNVSSCSNSCARTEEIAEIAEIAEIHKDSRASDSVDSQCSSALLAQACPQELDSLPYLNDVWNSYEADIAAAALVVGTADFKCHSSNSSSIADLACRSDYDDLEFTS
jgi:hypothetical protein